MAGAHDHLDDLTLLRCQLHAGEGVGEAKDAVQRRADLMTHVGQELALGDTGGLGAVQRPLERILGKLALGDVFRDRQKVVGAVAAGDQHLLAAQELAAEGRLHQLVIVDVGASQGDHFQVLPPHPVGHFRREDLLHRLADVLPAADPVDGLHGRVGDQHLAGRGVLDRDACGHALDHRLQKGAGALDLVQGPLASGDVLGDGQDVVAVRGAADQRLELVDVSGSGAGDDQVVLVQLALAAADQLALPLRVASGEVRIEHLLVVASEVLFGRLEAEDASHGLVGQQEPAVRGVLHGQAHGDVVDHRFQKSPGLLQRFLGALGLRDVLADRDQIG